MNNVLKTISALILLSVAAVGQGQTLTFNSNVVTGNGSVTPTLTWSTTPAAQSCTASGDWTGSKAVSGTQALAAINTSRTYNLSCTWPGDTTATVRWTPPTTNTNGTAYTDPKGFRVVYNTGPPTESNLSAGQQRIINDPAAASTVFTGLTAGTWNFAVYAVNQRDVESVISNIAAKTITATNSVSRSVGITVNPVPGPAVITVE